MDLEAIKNYLKVEHEEDDRQLLNQMAAAKSYYQRDRPVY
ncbi:head-tail connector protein [Bacillus velezensis]|nr:head-tail connector protein [Bacillus velezensis]